MSAVERTAAHNGIAWKANCGRLIVFAKRDILFCRLSHVRANTHFDIRGGKKWENARELVIVWQLADARHCLHGGGGKSIKIANRGRVSQTERTNERTNPRRPYWQKEEKTAAEFARAVCPRRWFAVKAEENWIAGLPLMSIGFLVRLVIFSLTSCYRCVTDCF